MQGKDRKKTIEDRVNNLPLLSKNVLEIIALLDDAKSSFEKIVEKLTPEVTAKFLSMANSAFYGVEVKSITHALRVLGYNAMRQSLVTSLLIDHFDRFSGLESFRLDKYHKQAHFCASVSRILGEILEYEHLANLVTVSMLHNIGKLIIAVYFGDEHNQIIVLKEQGGVRTHDAERRILGSTHAEISAMVLKKLNIPDDLCQAVRYHDTGDEHPPVVADYQLMYILRESARIVDRLDLELVPEPPALVEEMEDTVTEGREACRELQRQEIKLKGYEEIFGMLLGRAAEFVERDLETIIKARAALNDGPEGLDSKSTDHDPHVLQDIGDDEGI
jgi:HD-like signal output (HDOD) protein